MPKRAPEAVTRPKRRMVFNSFLLALALAVAMPAMADEADAKRLLKAMSDYLAAQEAFSFNYDATLEVVTVDGQVLGIASSGSVAVNRPDKIRASRQGGFADVEMIFNGKTMTVFGKNVNMYTEIEAPGSIDNLIDVMRNQYGRPLPAADLLSADAYDTLMQNVNDVKDLGSGVIGGVECDSLAFRSDEVDWQIWIAHGDQPYPCRLVITSKTIEGGPQYSIQTSQWATGAGVAVTDFNFVNSTGAQKVDVDDLQGAGDLPGNFTKGEPE